MTQTVPFMTLTMPSSNRLTSKRAQAEDLTLSTIEFVLRSWELFRGTWWAYVLFCRCRSTKTDENILPAAPDLITSPATSEVTHFRTRTVLEDPCLTWRHRGRELTWRVWRTKCGTVKRACAGVAHLFSTAPKQTTSNAMTRQQTAQVSMTSSQQISSHS